MAAPSAKIPAIWTTGWTDGLKTGTWRNEIAVHQKSPAPCHGACPVDGEIPVWIEQTHNQDLHAAWLTLVEHNPIPAAIGRTCHRPCEGACNRRQYDGGVAINALEQYVGDMAIAKGWALPSPAKELDQKVAIVGGGPAGLSCAYQLRRKGFQVTLFEANPELGGVLRYGVPEFRLPAKIIAAEAARIAALGVKVVTGRRITGLDLDSLLKEHAAVFLALGAHRPKRLPQFPKGDGRVSDAIDFLRALKIGKAPKLGSSVVVVGGGSVAMDAAASAIRLGSSARVIAVETRAAMPAEEGEIQDFLDEGGSLIDGAMVKRVEASAGGLLLHCAKCRLDPAAAPGALIPREVKNTDFALQADSLILAVGQDPDLGDWEASLASGGGMLATNHNYMTSRTGVFAAGDVASAVRYVSTAVGDGKRAAQAIARSLGQAQDDLPAAGTKEVGFASINLFYFPPAEQRERAKRDIRDRNTTFDEIRLGYSAEQALSQSERCFSCGSCIECDNCLYFCPDMAIVKDPGAPLHYRVLEEYCKGCGACVAECPRGAMALVEETK